MRFLLPQLLMPTTIIIALVFAGLLLKRLWMIWVALTILWIASTPVISSVLMRSVEGWRERAEISAAANADAIVVLSFGIRSVPGDTSALEFDDFDRFLAGFDLFRAGKAPKLVFTGGWSTWKPDLPLLGDILVARAHEFGIAQSALLTTGRVSTTEEEAAAVGKLLGAVPRPRILLVTSAFHMTRAELLFRRAGFDVIPFPADFQTSTGVTLRSFIPRGDALQQTELALRELLGRLYYWVWQ